MNKQSSKSTGITAYDDKWAKDHMRTGMSGVDPSDIKPPQILLVQKTSKITQMQTTDGKVPTIGQFFHTGKFEIYETFDCYILSATKSKWINRNKKEEPEEDQYVIVGLLKKDLSLFGMKFRGTSLWALSPLFTATVCQKKPMFSFNITMETKFIEGKQNDWYVPVCRVGKPEVDPIILTEIFLMATQLDQKITPVVEEEEELTKTTEEQPDMPKGNEPDGSEDIKLEEMPF